MHRTIAWQARGQRDMSGLSWWPRALYMRGPIFPWQQNAIAPGRRHGRALRLRKPYTVKDRAHARAKVTRDRTKAAYAKIAEALLCLPGQDHQRDRQGDKGMP
jgi:hypothetical protein